MKKKINIDGEQNVEVSKPIPCEKITAGATANYGGLYQST